MHLDHRDYITQDVGATFDRRKYLHPKYARGSMTEAAKNVVAGLVSIPSCYTLPRFDSAANKVIRYTSVVNSRLQIIPFRVTLILLLVSEIYL